MTVFASTETALGVGTLVAAYVVMADVVIAYIAMAYIAMAYMVIADVVMAYMVLAARTSTSRLRCEHIPHVLRCLTSYDN